MKRDNTKKIFSSQKLGLAIAIAGLVGAVVTKFWVAVLFWVIIIFQDFQILSLEDEVDELHGIVKDYLNGDEDE